MLSSSLRALSFQAAADNQETPTKSAIKNSSKRTSNASKGKLEVSVRSRRRLKRSTDDLDAENEGDLDGSASFQELGETPVKKKTKAVLQTADGFNVNEMKKNPLLIFREAKSALRTSASVDGGTLVGRDEEREQLHDFWERHVISKKSGSLYVSGAPGVGKSALLDELLTDTKVRNSPSLS